ncbi:hypothetical protein SKAU_G00225240 [Synaphobranchus kaupii]|uniref:Complement subcomponent C1r n=1 Tax=Synaphobranchus kaupii TaxID=118154 RepID=A0A9Q1FBS6_SYNKA|nr:hypothetical protein SKAU_G00225240 [Synaphobranchus kaupii]
MISLLVLFLPLSTSLPLLGWVESPGYPCGYPNEAKHDWERCAPPGHVLYLTLTHLDLEDSDGCEHDALEIFSGEMKLVSLCGRKSHSELQSSVNPSLQSNISGCLRLSFHSDYSKTQRHRGFRAFYTVKDVDECVDPDNACNQYCANYIGGYRCFCWPGYYLEKDEHSCTVNCSMDLSGSALGTVSSPGRPGPYPEHALCTFTLAVDDHLQLVLEFAGAFDVQEAEGGQCVDSVTIKTPSREFGPFCGSVPPSSPLLTNSHQVQILFSSDATGTNTGFTFKYTTTAKTCPNEVTPNSSASPQMLQYRQGDQITVTCDPGHFPTAGHNDDVNYQDYKSVCQSTGVWNPIFPCDPAHMVEKHNASGIQIYGDLFSRRDLVCEKIIYHPQYKTDISKDKRLDYNNDIALIKLASRAKLNHNLRPICLPEKKEGSMKDKVVIDCGDPSPLLNGGVSSLSGAENKYLSVIEYHCNTPYYTLVDGVTVNYTCREDRKWKDYQNNYIIPKCSSVCGRPIVPYKGFLKVLGGANAPEASIPWQVFLVVGGRGGAAVIGDQWLLTAAQNLLFYNKVIEVELVKAYVGGNDVHKFLNTSPLRIASLHPHPLFNGSTGNNYNNDIALIKLSEPITFNKFVMPLCLPADDSKYQTGKSGLVSGFGIAEGMVTNQLKYIELPLVDRDMCSRSINSRKEMRHQFHKSPEFTDNMFCAGFPERMMDACHGDSGGAFALKENERYWAAGIPPCALFCPCRPLCPCWGVESPGYPWGYPNEAKRDWERCAPPGHVLYLTLTHLDLEDSDGCEHDALEIFSGEVKLVSLCGRKSRDELQSSVNPSLQSDISGCLRLSFHSDYSNTQRHSGFRAFYTVKDVDECVDPDNACNQYCANYIGGYRCFCWPGYYLEKDEHSCTVNCSMDLSGSALGTIKTPSREFGPFCGSVLPSSPLLTNSHQVQILFSSDATGTNTGFTLKYTTTAKTCPNEVTPNSSANPQMLQYRQGDQITVTCDPGHFPTAGHNDDVNYQDYKSVCQSTGVWNPIFPCDPVECDLTDLTEKGRVPQAFGPEGQNSVPG